MCYTIPGKVTQIDGKIAIVDYFGEKKRAVNELENLAAGDYVYAQGGYVIQKVTDSEAQEMLLSWQEIFSQLKEVDSEISNGLNKPVASSELKVILDKVKSGTGITNFEAEYLLNISDPDSRTAFLSAANYLRLRNHGNACCVHGIIEISNNCARSCAYCGISKYNQQLQRYRMSKEEILQAVYEAVEINGFKALVLQSGENCGYSIAELAQIIREIKNKHAVLIIVSFGEIGFDGLKDLFSAGARGLLLRFETSNPWLYRKFHPGCDLKDRIDHLKKAREIGYMIMTGALVGLPGQTNGDIIRDIRLTGELGAEMFSFGPFITHPQTLLADSANTDPQKMLSVLALARLLAPKESKILVTTAFETLDQKVSREALLSGATSMMVNLTPLKYRLNYSIYPHRAHESEEAVLQINQMLEMLRSLGRAPVDLGVSSKFSI